MAWSAEFLEKLGHRFTAPKFAWRIRGTIFVREVVAGDYHEHIISGSIRIGGQRVESNTWQSTLGAFSFETVLTQEELTTLFRGRVLELLCGFDDWAPSRYQRIGLGVVKNVRGRYPSHQVECWDIMTALMTRQTLSDIERTALFAGNATVALPTNTITTTSYNGGAIMNVLPPLDGFELETGAAGLVRVNPNAGGPYFVTYTGKTVNTLTGCTTAALNTTHVNSGTNALVNAFAYTQAHPTRVIEKLLVSTGLGTNGPDDLLPDSWGFGLDANFLDESDIKRLRDNVLTVSSGSYVWDYHTDVPLTSPFQTLRDQLAEVGVWPIIREGEISLNAVQEFLTRKFANTYAIDDDDIQSVDNYEAFYGSQPVEYKKTTASGIGAGGAIQSSSFQELGNYASLPADPSDLTIDLTDRLYSNVLNVTTEVVARVGPWRARIPELLQVTVSPISFARYAPGDVALLTTRRLFGRFKETAGGYDQWPMLTIEVSPDWERNRVQITMLNLPPNGDLFP